MSVSPDEVRTVGFIGAGHIGSTLARLFLRTGRQVVLTTRSVTGRSPSSTTSPPL
jgi:predicted dinucleotide-binding enzyme